MKDSFKTKLEDGKVTVENAKVIKTDVAAKTAVIHVIDTAMLSN